MFFMIVDVIEWMGLMVVIMFGVLVKVVVLVFVVVRMVVVDVE